MRLITVALALSLYITTAAWADVPPQPAPEGQGPEPANVVDDTAGTKSPEQAVESQSHTAAANPAPAATPRPDPDSGEEAKAKAVDPVALKKAGYRIVNENGQTLYCRQDMSTGSHVKKTTTCLTERELQQLKDSTRREVEYMQKRNPPRQDRAKSMPPRN